MDRFQILGYALTLFGVLVAAGIVLFVVAWTVLCLMKPWADRTVAKHIEAADAAEYPELDEESA